MPELSLQQNLSLGQTLSPQMQQSLQLLQAPVMELQSLVQQELEMNPVLEEPLSGHEKSEERDSVSGQESEVAWEKEVKELARQAEEWRDYFAQSRASSSYSAEDAKRRQFLFDSQVEAPKLSEHLREQLTFATSRPDLLRAGEEIIGNIDEAGYLKASVEEMALACGLKMKCLQEALALIQTFDPIGVASRDLNECLFLQLNRLGKAEEIEGTIVQYYLDLLGRKKYLEIARTLKVPIQRVQQAARFIATLQPRPGSQFSSEEKQNIIQAELAVVLDKDEGWKVVMNDDPIPRLYISSTYKDLLGQTRHDPQLREYLREKIRSGKFLIKCLHQRQQTIQQIATDVVKRQNEFFNKGVAYLKPLTMSQVAEAVGVHETTVSRAIANKYMQTPFGLYEMKFFFTPGYQTASGESVSNASVKEAIQELISQEDPEKPWSDHQIVKVLEERGIQVARRTVAKYRDFLHILPSHLRRTV